MNPAPASTADLNAFRKIYLAQLGADMDQQQKIKTGAAYQAGDPDAVAARYRIHFKHALARPADYGKLMTAMKSAFVRQGKDGIIKARAVEDRLMADTWAIESYDLLPKIRALAVPTLVIAGDRDFFPVDIAAHIAQAMPNARLVTLKNCGHFAYMECAADVRSTIDSFLK
jgi:pimeloyl-ACP methyl ester carboxylesterase